MRSNWSEKLLPDQRKAQQFVLRNNAAALLCEQGTGKTIITLAVLEKLSLTNVLIVTPLTSVEVTWGKRLREAGLPVNLEPAPLGVTVIGYEYFRNNIKKILKISWDMVIFDESQGLKDRNSKQSRAARQLRNKAPRRLILSGTPVDESPIDMWAQMRFVDPKCFGDVWDRPRKPKLGQMGPYFAEEFCNRAGFMGKQWQFRSQRTGEFLSRLAPYCYRLTIDALQEPPEFIEVPVGMYGHQRRVYNQMEMHGIVRLPEAKIKAGLTITRNLRLLQITGGFIRTDDGTDIKVGHAKERKLRILIRRLKKPVVFCRFLTEVEDVRKILKESFDRVGVLHGNIKNKKNDKARDRLLHNFQSGRLDALVCQTRTGGVSIELTQSHELVFYSMGYSFIDFQQIIARLRRMGQEQRVRVFLIYARNSIDEEPLDRIIEKGLVVNPMMDFLKRKSK